MPDLEHDVGSNCELLWFPGFDGAEWLTGLTIHHWRDISVTQKRQQMLVV